MFTTRFRPTTSIFCHARQLAQPKRHSIHAQALIPFVVEQTVRKSHGHTTTPAHFHTLVYNRDVVKGHMTSFQDC